MLQSAGNPVKQVLGWICGMVFIAGVWVGSSTQANAKTKVLTAKERKDVLARFRKWVNSIDTYKLETVIQMGTPGRKFLAINHIWGQKDKRLRIRMRMENNVPPQLRQRVPFTHRIVESVYGKTWQYVRIASYKHSKQLNARYIKLKRSKLATPAAPFDTGYTFRGCGLTPGKDFPASMKDLLRLYRITKAYMQMKGKDAVVVLEGLLRPGVFIRHFQKHSSHLSQKQAKEMGASLGNMSGKLILHLHMKTMHPITLQQGYASIFPSKYPRMPMGMSQISYKHFSRTLPKGIFQMKIPPKAKVRDITKMLLQQRAIRNKP